MRAVLATLLPFVMACGGDGERPTGPGPAESCDDPLALALGDGSCPRPGVPLDGCGEGFVHDGQYGCEPVLPADPCPPGTMAVPGETVCRAVMPCGEGKWGDIPRDGTTQHVDASYVGTSDGSEAQPWTTITEGVLAAVPGAVVAVAEGVYPESVLLGNKSVQIRGVCPDRVVVQAPAVGSGSCPPSGFCISGAGSDGAVLSGMSVTGAGVGVLVSGTGELTVERMRVFDNAVRGVNAQDTLGPTAITIRGALIEGNTAIGVFAGGAEVVVEGSVVRDTRQLGGETGFGIMVSDSCVDTPTGQACNPDARSAGTVTRSLVERNHEAGVAVIASDLTVEDSVIRATLPRGDGEGGQGVALWSRCDASSSGCEGTEAVGLVRRSVLAANHAGAIFATGADVTVEASVLRDSLPKPSDGTKGTGITLQSACELDDTAVICAEGVSTRGTLQRSLVVGNHDVALFASGSEVLVEDSVLRDTLPRASDGINGRGLNLQGSCYLSDLGVFCNEGYPSTGSVGGTLVENSYGLGIFVGGSSVDVARSVVRNTASHASDGLGGDGIAYESVGGDASGHLDGVIVGNSARAGVGNFGAQLSLANSTIRCAAFALTGESVNGQSFEMVDDGGNVCGCDGDTEPCQVISAGLEPPGL